MQGGLDRGLDQGTTHQSKGLWQACSDRRKQRSLPSKEQRAERVGTATRLVLGCEHPDCMDCVVVTEAEHNRIECDGDGEEKRGEHEVVVVPLENE